MISTIKKTGKSEFPVELRFVIPNPDTKNIITSTNTKKIIITASER